MFKVVFVLFVFFAVVSTIDAGSLTVVDSVIGHTLNYIGTVEGGHFDINDMLDCGINSIRLYVDMIRTEWEDDDDDYGSPSIDSIKADSVSGFSNTIPWDFWDTWLTDSTLWWTGISFDELLNQCSANGIQVVLALRPVNPDGWPTWAPRSPYDMFDWNEWWEYCFAIAYWCNVRHNYSISFFQVHNEPDLPSQGWDGTLAEYADLVRYTSDAARFANSFSGNETYIFAPVVAKEESEYMSYTIQQVDSIVDVVDYHEFIEFSDDQINAAQVAYDTMVTYDNDGNIEPLWISEWGTYSQSYNTLIMAIRLASDLIDFSLFDTLVGTHCLGSSQFLMWDWGGFDGLVNSDSSRNETYYAFRLCCRGMQNGKEILFNQYDGDGRILTTQDTSFYHIVGMNINDTVVTDVSQIGIMQGSAHYYIYDEIHKDSLVDTLDIQNGNFSFFCPESALVCIDIPIVYPGVESSAKARLQISELGIRVIPNPFSEKTDIWYSIAHSSALGGLKIYDVTGRCVKQFDRKTIRLSDHVVWDGTDESGKALPSGIYFIRLRTGTKDIKEKLLKILKISNAQ